MSSLLKRGLGLALFAVGLFAGLQLPGFVQQYEQRVSARLAEAELSLSGFQAVANEFHDGDLAALIEHHRRSRDNSFRAEAEVIYAQWKRVGFLTNEQAALSGPLPTQLWHLAWSGNREILNSTAQGYSNVVPINTGAMVSGVMGGLLLLSIFLLGTLGLRLAVEARQTSLKSKPSIPAITKGGEAETVHTTEQANKIAASEKITSTS